MPTVERGLCEVVFCSMEIAGDKPSIKSTSGFSIIDKNCLAYADNDLKNLVFEQDASVVGHCPARKSKLLSILTEKDGHEGVDLDNESFERLVTWIDTYAQRQGAFSERQEQELLEFRKEITAMLTD